MHIKPECDVETAEDFAKYYEGSFMESRDGRILKVAGHHGRNVVLRDFRYPDADEGHAYSMLPWRQVQTDLVYGRPPAGTFLLDHVAYLLYMPNNRQSGRGFACSYYAFHSLRTAGPVNWKNIADEYTIASAVFKPEYTPIDEAVMRAEAIQADSLLDARYSVVRRADGVHLYRGSRRAGLFTNNGALLTFNPGYKFCETAVRNLLGYKGVIAYAPAA